jgi:hypothetical protein
MLGPRADRKHRRLERKVLQAANVVTVVSHDMKRQFEEMGFRNIRVIQNGFDPDDFDSPVQNTDPEFSMTHIGTIVPSRNPDTLWSVLSEFVKEDKDLAKDLVIRMIGAVDYSVTRSLDEHNLGAWVQTVDYLPHQEAVEMLKRSQILLLLINNTPNAKGILTGKFFEYMNSGRPILAIGPTDGEAAHILKETGTGEMVEFSDRNNLKRLILDYHIKYREGELNVDAEGINNYSRKSLTGRMTELFTEILSIT